MSNKPDMNERVLTILTHMLTDAKDIVELVEKVGTYEAFSQEPIMMRKGLVMSLLNIGELANHLPVEYTDAHQELPWRRMVDMRNLAAHGYHKLKYRQIWNTAKTSVPELLEFLKTQVPESK